MPLRVDEGVTLRTHPLREADMIVSVFTREHGKVRGVARGARKLKSRFGAALEPMCRSRFIYFEREGRELVTLDEADLLSCPHGRDADLEVAWTLQYVAEVVDLVATEGDAQPLLFRLLVAVTDSLAGGSDPALAARYFELWLLRFQGILPELSRCGVCGGTLGRGATLRGVEEIACTSCVPHRGPAEGPRLGPAAVAFLHDAAKRHLREVAGAGHAPAAVREAGAALHEILVRYLGREPRALLFLQKLEVLP